MLRQAHEAIVKCHQCHSELLFYEADNQDLRISMLMVHAADHLTSADMTEAMAEEIIHLYKEIRHV